MNTITIIGNLASDARMHNFDGREVIFFTLICNVYKNSIAFQCSYNRASENLIQHLTKGQKIAITGQINKTEIAQEKYININVLVDRLTFAGSADKDKTDAPQTSPKPYKETKEELKGTENLNNKDLPF